MSEALPHAPLQPDVSQNQDRLHGFSDSSDAVVSTKSPYQPQISPPTNPYAEIARNGDSVAVSGPDMSSSHAQAPMIGHSSPPQRPRTLSPPQQVVVQQLAVPFADQHHRPVSATGPASPTKANYLASPVVHIRGPSQQLDFVPPDAGQPFDPLERWKGAPVVEFGFGGVVSSCFPRHIPRYMPGRAAPSIKPSAGEVKTSRLTDWISTGENIVEYPGPLKTKSKKKDTVAWLSGRIAAFENEGLSESSYLHPEPHKRQEEKILLWKLVRLLVENDGALEGSEQLRKRFGGILFPGIDEGSTEQNLYANGLGDASSVHASGSPDSISPVAVEALRSSLLRGEREKAVWEAVDNRLWGHAMIIASTLNEAVWKQVVQEFVRREVRSVSGNSESLASLYQVFAGNVEESVDELVPPSVRAGLQMVSRADIHGPAKSGLGGLESWRDTLQLVLRNRSHADSQALVSLGRLLSDYGRTEAAHICYLFSGATVFGGAGDSHSDIVLLGADHQRFKNSLGDEDCICLTEVYEFATSVLAGSSTAVLPHLLAYKLIHAKSLVEIGRNAEALQYCDAIAGTVKATTKPSRYYTRELFSEVDELSARLKQSASEDASSWISRPSMEKVSGSMWAKFSSFVTGDDSDAASTGSGRNADADVGPFARVSGTPTISRPPSVTDSHGAYPAPFGTQPIPIAGGGASRYQPMGHYAPSASPDHLRRRASFDSQRSGGSFAAPPMYALRRDSLEPSGPVDGNQFQSNASAYSSSPTAAHFFSPPQTSMPLPSVSEARGGEPHASISGYVPPVIMGAGGYAPPMDDKRQVSTPAIEEPGDATFDDGQDAAAAAAVARKAEQDAADRAADEAFRRAAEEDGKFVYHIFDFPVGVVDDDDDADLSFFWQPKKPNNSQRKVAGSAGGLEARKTKTAKTAAEGRSRPN